MGYPAELLKAAHDLIGIDPPTQATLRRAVSTAYYALFHLLISEACQLWKLDDHRARLSRQFEHRQMKEASDRLAKRLSSSTVPVEHSLAFVAQTFGQLQQRRHDCDYDLAITISEFEASSLVYDIESAFEQWEKVRTEKIAQDYLYSLLFRERK